MKKQIRILSEKVLKLQNDIKTEEATKTSFILPLLQILGYDIFNPQELMAEAVSDIGAKKGEKVDYLLCKDKSPILIIECKKWTENLNSHVSQLVRYFHTSKSKFSLLTNGIEYQFFSDLDQPNIMDAIPFFTFNLLNFNESDLDNLILFSKSSFSEATITELAESLKYLSKIKNVILKELSEPSKEFSELIIRQVYSGRLTAKTFASYNNLILKSLSELFPKENSTNNENKDNDSGIVTTEEELQFYNEIINKLPEFKDDLIYKDFKGHFSILFKGNTRQCVAKALFNTKKKYYILFSEDGEIKQEFKGFTDEDLLLIRNKIEEFKK
jgi:hypothetical protein